MIKKIFLILILNCLVISCGKKGDPIYTDPQKETATQRAFLNKT